MRGPTGLQIHADLVRCIYVREVHSWNFNPLARCNDFSLVFAFSLVFLRCRSLTGGSLFVIVVLLAMPGELSCICFQNADVECRQKRQKARLAKLMSFCGSVSGRGVVVSTALLFRFQVLASKAADLRAQEPLLKQISP